MRAAQLDENNVVINFAEVGGFFGCFIDPLDSVLGSVWDGEKFNEPTPIPKTRDQLKAERADKVSKIVVTIDGMNFDGDETSQNRMARAVVALNSANVSETLWILSDNTIASVTAEQLSKALAAAGLAQTALWPIEE